MTPIRRSAKRGGIDLGGHEDPGDHRRRRRTTSSASRAVRRRTTAARTRSPTRWRRRCARRPAPPASRPASLRGVGVGSPGRGRRRDRVRSRTRRTSPPGPTATRSGRTSARQLGTRVAVGNDVGVATHAEYELGAGRGHDSVLGVFWGTGVGGGLILGGKQWHGRGSAGEIGHMVVKRDGARCPCGNHGCMEAYAGRSAMESEARRRVEDGDHTDLFKLMAKHDKPRLTSGIWERALDHGDKMAEELIDRAVKALGAGIASAVNLLDPEIVILGGGLGVRFGERLGPDIRERMERNLFDHENPPEFKVAALGDFGGALGAALLVA